MSVLTEKGAQAQKVIEGMSITPQKLLGLARDLRRERDWPAIRRLLDSQLGNS